MGVFLQVGRRSLGFYLWLMRRGSVLVGHLERWKRSGGVEDVLSEEEVKRGK